MLGCFSGGHRNSGDESGEKDNRGKNTSIVPVRKFLQTAPRLDSGREAFHNLPNGILLLAVIAVFTTLVVRARMQLCRMREQEDAEAERLLESTGDIANSQVVAPYLCTCVNRKQ